MFKRGRFVFFLSRAKKAEAGDPLQRDTFLSSDRLWYNVA